jgi:hypothetical protein
MTTRSTSAGGRTNGLASIVLALNSGSTSLKFGA